MNIDTLVIVISLALCAILTVPITALGCYVLSAYNIFFTKVPSGEIIVVTSGDKATKFIGNVTDYWVDPETGKVFETSKVSPLPSIKIPTDIFGTGIYWLGVSPIARRYTYEFHWNKWAKPVSKDGESAEYAITPRKGIVDSVYFRAQYPIQVSGCETSEGVPLTMTILITVEMRDVSTALFKIKSPGWLSALSGQVTAVIREWNGNNKVSDINELKAEIPDTGTKSTFQENILKLSDSNTGNPSIEETLGVTIIAVSFVSYSIDKPQNQLQEASIAKYFTQKKTEAEIAAAEGAEKIAEHAAKATQTTADAAAYTIEKEGEAKANARQKMGDADARAREALGRADASATVALGKATAEALVSKANAEAEALSVTGGPRALAAKQLAEAVRDNPHQGAMAMATAITEQKTATTLVLGSGAVPTVAVSTEKEAV